MIVLVNKAKTGGAVVLIGIPKRGQEFLRRGQPAIVEGATLAGPSADGALLTESVIAIAFADTEREIVELTTSATGRPANFAVTHADRAEDLSAMVDDLAEGTPAGSEALSYVLKARTALNAAQREFRKEGAS